MGCEKGRTPMSGGGPAEAWETSRLEETKGCLKLRGEA